MPSPRWLSDRHSTWRTAGALARYGAHMSEDFATFINQNGPRLLRFGVLLCGNRADAEDLLQDVLVRVYPRWRSIQEQQPEAYIRRAMTNRLISRQRSPWIRRRDPEVPDVALPADDMSHVDIRATLLAALRTLPPRMRAIVLLRYWMDYSEQQTALALDCSVGSVKSQSSRGVQRLRECMAVLVQSEESA